MTGRVPGVAQSKSETVVFGGAKDPAAPCRELDLCINHQNVAFGKKSQLTVKTIW
jgi:hypothetical protein